MTNDPFAVLDQPEPAGRGNILFFDFETVPDETRFPRPTTDDEPSREYDPEVVVAGSVADAKSAIDNCSAGCLSQIEAAEKRRDKPRKGILDAVASRRSTGDNALAAWVKEGSVNPLWCRVVAIGFAIDDGPIRALSYGPGPSGNMDDDERAILVEFWSSLMLCQRRCGYNISNFDDTVLGFRSAILGLDIPFQINRSRYRNPGSLDLMNLLFPNGSPKKCKDVARAVGIEVPAGDVDGSQVYDLWTAGDVDAIEKYVASDVHVERELYRKFRPVFAL